MSNKKIIEVKISTILLILFFIVLLAMGYYIYTIQNTKNLLEKENALIKDKATSLEKQLNHSSENTLESTNIISKDSTENNESTNTQSNNLVSPNTEKTEDSIYQKCEKKIPNVSYRRETGESSNFFIKNGILYSGEKNLTETQKKCTGISGTIKYVVPLDKQTGKTIVLTAQKKVYINEEKGGLYNSNFNIILENKDFIEILEIPNEDDLFLLGEDEKIYYINGDVYMDLNSSISSNSKQNSDSNLKNYIGTWYESKDYVNDQNPNVITIKDINNNYVSFDLYFTRTADFNNVKLEINNNSGKFEAFSDDSSAAKITGKIILEDNMVEINIENSDVVGLRGDSIYIFTYKK